MRAPCSTWPPRPASGTASAHSFVQYAGNNLVATQRRLRGRRSRPGAARVVWSSSSSVYGDAETHPCREGSTPTLPRSPYGVTKRACEDLARVYRTHGLAITGLRYFTVYGPRQRPDMAMRRICDALVSGAAVPAVRRRLAVAGLHAT